MTEDDFFAELARVRDGKWVLVSAAFDAGDIRSGVIRHPEHHCPVMAVIRSRYKHERKSHNQVYLDYGADFVNDVMRAADNKPGHRLEIRARLLVALGMT